jgi:hypothetical protein
VRRRRSTSRRDLIGDEGNSHDRALGTWGGTRALSGLSSKHGCGHNASAEAPEAQNGAGWFHGGANLLRRAITRRTGQ